MHGSSDPLYSGRGADSASIEIGKDVCNFFLLPIKYIQEVPLEESKTCQYLQELKRFNPLIFNDMERIGLDESDLILALRDTKKILDSEILMEERIEKQRDKTN